jgi:hypothetical protein
VLSGFGGHIRKKECNPPHSGRDTNDWVIIFEKIEKLSVSASEIPYGSWIRATGWWLSVQSLEIFSVEKKASLVKTRNKMLTTPIHQRDFGIFSNYH